MKKSVEIFVCYAHEDDKLRQELVKQLRLLQRQEIISLWHDREISAGTDWQREIGTHLNAAQIVLLLISPDFMDSDYCYSIEMKQAIEQHQRGETRVIPIILRHVDWEDAPFHILQVLPTQGKPVVSSSWYNFDEAFLDVVKGIKKVIKELETPSSDASSLPISSHINILLASANPIQTQRLRLDYEIRTIQDTIQRSQYRDNITLTAQYATTVHHLREIVLGKQIHILHFSGHGTHDGGLILEDEDGLPHLVREQSLAELFNHHSSSLQCVVLLSNYSAPLGLHIVRSIPFVVAIKGILSDKAALEFSRGFYGTIGAGRSIASAYEIGCCSVLLAGEEARFEATLLQKDQV